MTFQELHSNECPHLSNSPAPSFLWMTADALEKMPEPETELKSSFHHLSLYFNSWSKIQASSEQSPSEKPQDFNFVHPPQTLHTVNCVTTSSLMSRSPCWVASGLLGVSLSQSPGPSKPKATWWLYQELASLPLTNSGWGVNMHQRGRWPFVLGSVSLTKSVTLEVSQLIWALIWAAWTKS